jgi:membrane associated rhomboid family serine protease
VQIGLTVVVAVAALMWLVEIVDSVLLSDAWQRQGIMPRTWSGLDGVLWAPFLHGSYGHLASNTVPFVFLSGIIVVTRNVRTWLVVSGIVTVVGGLAVWLVARGSIHLGASILIFGYISYLMVAGFFERSATGVVVGVVVALLYGGTLVFGVLPVSTGVSWEGHLFGAGAGVVAASMLGRKASSETGSPGM